MFSKKLAVILIVAWGLVLSGCAKQYKKADEITRADFAEFLASSEKEDNVAKNAFDGNTSTRWESEWGTDPSWIAIGLKEKSVIGALSINWEASAASVYRIEISDDGKKWKKVAKIEDGQGSEERLIKLDKPVTAKYLRILGERRTMEEYGYSIWEVKLNPVTVDTENKVSIVSAKASSEGPAGAAQLAIDGDDSTRWESDHGVDPGWIEVKLGKKISIQAVKIKWETASAKVYKIQVSNDGNTWKDVADINDGQSGEERMITFKPVKAKYVKIYGEERNGEWGYSIWELAVYK